MKLAFSLVLAFACGVAAGACSSDNSDSGTPVAAAGAAGEGAETSNGGVGAAGAASATADDACHTGCIATLAAACSNGPADQAGCESTCHELETGKCGGEYAAFQSCAEGKAISCGQQGTPVVSACSDEQAAFIACING